MNELDEALTLIHEAINAGCTSWRMYQLERLLATVRERYFLDPDDVAVAVPDGDDDELVEITGD